MRTITDLSIPNSFVAGTTAVAADVNENFEAIRDFINTTGVPALQDGAVSSAAKMANAIVTPAKLAAPEVLRYYLSADVAFATSGTTHTLTSSTRTWTQALAPVTSNYVGWDATNKRPYAKIAGLYRVSYSAVLNPRCSSGTDILLAYAYLASSSGGSQVESRSSGASMSQHQATHSDTVVLSLGVNEYVELSAKLEAGGFGTWDGSNSKAVGVKGTFIELEYIGPAS